MTQPAEQLRRSGLFHCDAVEIDFAEIIERELRHLAAAQDADRIGARLIGPNKEIVAGVFGLDECRQLAPQLADYNQRGWNIYAHIQAVGAPFTHRLLSGALGCVRTEGIRAYSTLVIDIDPEAGAEPGVALEVAWGLLDVLVDSARVPLGAISVLQSGRGAYVLVNIEPQPLSARNTIRRATSTLARIIEAAELPAHGDKSVFDTARIIRVAGTINRKPDADPTAPCWVLQRATPGVRCPWAIVERIAAKDKPKLRVVTSEIRTESAFSSRRPLRDLLRDRGWLGRDRADGVTDITCPNHAQHTDGRDAAILYPPKQSGGAGWIHCSHMHCADLTLFDWFGLLEGRA